MWKTTYRMGPGQTPKLITRLILITAIVSITSAIINPIFAILFDIVGPQQWLSLSWWGLSNFLIFQPLTYPFVMDSGPMGVSLGDLITLGLQMYAIWVLGSSVLERIGTRSFLSLYFLSSLFAGVLTVFLFSHRHYLTLAGPSASIISILTLWAMLYPKAELFFFFLIPVKGKWIVTIILGALFLNALSYLNWVNFLFYFFATLFSYGFGVLFWGLKSPFQQTHTFDQWLYEMGRKLGLSKSAKILDIKKYQKKDADDDAFVDKMLEKIAKHGEDSLTWFERRRMQKISEKKRRNMR